MFLLKALFDNSRGGYMWIKLQACDTFIFKIQKL